MPTSQTGAVSQFTLSLKLNDICQATTALLTHLPSIELDSIPPPQRRGFINSLERLHAELHAIKQRLAALDNNNQ